MRAAKETALIGVFTALTIGGQVILSGITGIEVVTVLLLSFSYYFGVRLGLGVANAFSLLRCLVFGFFPTAIVLYLVYYNLFVILFGLIGRARKHTLSVATHVWLVAAACLMTVLFTGLDDIITPLFYGFTAEATKAYAAASVTALVPHVICVALTVTFLLPVLLRAYASVHYFGNM